MKSLKSMSQATRVSVMALSLASVAAGVGVAYAEKAEGENDAFAAAKAKVSLVQAIGAAEQHVNGKASRAEFEKTKQGYIYEVEVVSGTKVFDVRVDTSTGAVVSSKEDTPDRGEDRDEKD